MKSNLTFSRMEVCGPQSALPDYYAEERQAQDRVRARQARARNALRLAGLMIGVAGLAGALRAWDAGLQP